MPLTDELSRLLRDHAEGKLTEAALRDSLRRLVNDEGPDHPAYLRDELAKLRREAAMNKLDREFEEIRKECLVHYRGSYSEPSVHKFWGYFWLLVFAIGLLAAAVIFPFRWRGSEVWVVVAFLALVTGTSVPLLVELYRKGSRLDRAKALWQEQRAKLANGGSIGAASVAGVAAR